MSKVEERALEYCCAECVHKKLGCSMKVLHNGRDCVKSGNFIKGYEQAEKDLELTWEDVREMCKQSVLVEIDLGGLVSDERHYTEVLKRFKDFRERKEK